MHLVSHFNLSPSIELTEERTEERGHSVSSNTIHTYNMSDTISLAAHLSQVVPAAQHQELRDSVLPALIECTGRIAQGFRESTRVSLAGTANAFGDDQLNLDVLAENVVRESIAKCPAVVTASSEEEPVEVPVKCSTGPCARSSGCPYALL